MCVCSLFMSDILLVFLCFDMTCFLAVFSVQFQNVCILVSGCIVRDFSAISPRLLRDFCATSPGLFCCIVYLCIVCVIVLIVFHRVVFCDSFLCFLA